MIITVANSKGGVGKSTLAVHLAAWLYEQGCKVTLADCDTQQSSSEWIREAVTIHTAGSREGARLAA
jgi:chromosome partitioning protein